MRRHYEGVPDLEPPLNLPACTLAFNAACRAEGIRYGEFMHGLNKAGIELNRKVISELAIHEPDSFKELVGKAKAAIEA